jgi:hypothetical protein
MQSVWSGSKLILYRPRITQWLKVMVKGLKDDGTSEDASKLILKKTSISFTYK